MGKSDYLAWYPWGEIARGVGRVPRENVLSIDLETTGTHPGDDEILQLSICNGLSQAVVNKLYRPVRTSSWPDAEAVNGISPSDVRSAKPFTVDEARKVSSLLNSADLIVGYNWYGFDRKFLEAVGVDVNRPCFDVMLEYPIVPGMWNGYYKHWKWWKLAQCAEHYGYVWSGRAHDALNDAAATAYCYRKMVESGSDYCIASDKAHSGQWDSLLRDYAGVTRLEYTEYPTADEPDETVVRCFIDDLPDGLLSKRAEHDLSQAIEERGGRIYKTNAKGAAWTVIANPEWDAKRCSDVFVNRHDDGKKVCFLPDLIEYLGVEAKSLGTKWPAGRKRAARELAKWFPFPPQLKFFALPEAYRPQAVATHEPADFQMMWQELNTTRGERVLRTVAKMLFGRR